MLVPPGAVRRPTAREVDAGAGVAVVVKEDQPSRWHVIGQRQARAAGVIRACVDVHVPVGPAVHGTLRLRFGSKLGPATQAEPAIGWSASAFHRFGFSARTKAARTCSPSYTRRYASTIVLTVKRSSNSRRQAARLRRSTRVVAAIMSASLSQRKPVRPSVTISGTEPRRRAMTGVPQASASISARP